jgi:CRISPR-associated Csx14 family protein
MAVIISTLGLTPAIVTEMMDELQKRGVNVREVHVVTTKGAELSYHVLRVHLLHTKRYPERVEIKQTDVDLEDIISEKDVKTYRNRFQAAIKAVLKHTSTNDVYVNLAGGRKTMPIDAYLLALAQGIDNIYHVVAPAIGGVQDVNKKFQGDKAKAVKRASEEGSKPSEELLKEIDEYLHPSVEVSLIRIPSPALTAGQRKELLKQVLD